jgi:hypothetical protein
LSFSHSFVVVIHSLCPQIQSFRNWPIIEDIKV